jgi:hypothetical protein
MSIPAPVALVCSVPMADPAHRVVGALRGVPGIRAFGSYERVWLRSDLVAGVVLAAILVPQGMAYAELAGLPPVTGLYTTIACLVGYALMGPSRVLVLGPDSSVSPLIFAAIAPLALGRRFSLGGLGEMSGIALTELLEPVRDLLNADIFTDTDGHLAFGHDLIREGAKVELALCSTSRPRPSSGRRPSRSRSAACRGRAATRHERGAR